jgi:hypothetical protein
MRLGLSRQQGAAAIEYLVVTIFAVMTLIVSDASGAVTLAQLAQAIVNFYANFSKVISLATP